MKSVCDALAVMIRDSGMSIRQIAKVAAAPESTIRKLLNGETEDPRISTIDAVCRACGTTMERFFIRWAAQKSAQSCALNGAPKPASSQNVYNSRIFPDEGGDDALRMCHSLANTGHAFHGDIDKAQFDNAMQENAEAQVRDLQARLDKAIAARDKLKGEKHGQD